MVNPYAVYCIENFFNLWLLSKLKEFFSLENRVHFIRLIFNLISIIAPQFGEELLIPTSTKYTDYKRGLLKSFKTMSIRILQAV